MEKEREELGWLKDFGLESRDMKLCFLALSSRFSLDVCRQVCMLFISIRVTTTFKHSAKTVGWDFEVFIGNQKLSSVFEKLSHMFEL